MLSSSSRQRGFTLIEVMVALIVLVLGVLGSAAMMLNSLRDNKQSALRSQATAMAYELSDLMRADADYSSPVAQAAREAIFTGAPGAVVAACYTTGCAPADMATSDFAQWVAKLQANTLPMLGLPNATYKVCRDVAYPNNMSTCDNLATSPLVVKLKWDEKYNNGTFITSAAPNLVVLIRPF